MQLMPFRARPLRFMSLYAYQILIALTAEMHFIIFDMYTACTILSHIDRHIFNSADTNTGVG